MDPHAHAEDVSLFKAGISMISVSHTRFVLKCELNLPSVDVSSLPQVLNWSQTAILDIMSH